MSLVVLLCYVFGASLFAVAEGVDDYNTIRLGRRVVHGVGWAFRLLVLGGSAMWAACTVLHGPARDALALGLVGAGAFGMVFKHSLNEFRERDPLYVSPWSNWYDLAFYVIASLMRGRWVWKAQAAAARVAYFRGDVATVHAAGALQYIAEALALIVGAVLFT